MGPNVKISLERREYMFICRQSRTTEYCEYSWVNVLMHKVKVSYGGQYMNVCYAYGTLITASSYYNYKHWNPIHRLNQIAGPLYYKVGTYNNEMTNNICLIWQYCWSLLLHFSEHFIKENEYSYSFKIKVNWNDLENFIFGFAMTKSSQIKYVFTAISRRFVPF